MSTSPAHRATRGPLSSTREATPFGEGPKYLIRDNDRKFGDKFDTVADGVGIDIVRIPPKSPNCNPIVERFLRSVRGECLDHVVVLGEEQLRRVLREYAFEYFNKSRPHQGIGQRLPRGPDEGTATNTDGEVVARPILGGLHHDYSLSGQVKSGQSWTGQNRPVEAARLVCV
jgi:putative transposase